MTQIAKASIACTAPVALSALLSLAPCRESRADEASSPQRTLIAVGGRARQPAADECFDARAVAIYQGFGWSHFVDVTSLCDRGLACAVATDVDPEPQYTIAVAPWQTIRLRTRYGSSTRIFRPQVTCWFA